MTLYKFTYRSFIMATLLSLSALVCAQKTHVKVLDKDSGEPCGYSNVVLLSLDGLYVDAGATDKNGEISFDVEKAVKVCVSYVGYTAIQDTLSPGENKIIQLQAESIQMEAVVVTGQHQPKPVDKSIYKIDVIGSKILQERGVNNLAEALSNETSIRLRLDPSTGTSIEMQGMGGENIKYLIDGVPMVGRVFGNIDLEQINMENIDHIEIVKGPMSVQYGTSAIAGVINIITKKNSLYRNLAKANAYLDSKGHYNFGLYGSAIRGRSTFTLSGTRNMFQGQDIDLNVDDKDPDGKDRYMEFKPKRVYNADVDYAFKKNSFQLGIKSQYMNSLIKNYSNYFEGVEVKAYDADFYTTRSINSLVVSDQVSENFSYNIIGAYTWFGRHTDNITSDLHYLTHEVTSTTSTVFNNIMTRGNFTWAPVDAKYSLMTGWDVNYDNGHGDKIEDDAQIGDYALYLSGLYSPIEKISIQPGIRFIYNTIYGAPVIPSLNFQWNIIKNLGFRISYARGFRAPTLKELYLEFKDSNHDLSGNKDLKAETTNSFNTSFDYKLTGSSFSLKIEPSAFYNNGKDAITLIVTDPESNSATNVNLGGRRTMGGEIDTRFTHLNGLSLGAGFSRTGETFDEEGNGDYLPILYYNNYTASAQYRFKKFRAVLLANLKYYGETPSLAVIPEENGGGYYRVFTDPFGDLELTFTKNLWKNRLTLVVGGKNLFDNYGGRTYGYEDFGESDYEYERKIPLNYGRTWFVKLNLKLMK